MLLPVLTAARSGKIFQENDKQQRGWLPGACKLQKEEKLNRGNYRYRRIKFSKNIRLDEIAGPAIDLGNL
jgi:hypothetical protein